MQQELIKISDNLSKDEVLIERTDHSEDPAGGLLKGICIQREQRRKEWQRQLIGQWLVPKIAISTYEKKHGKGKSHEDLVLIRWNLCLLVRDLTLL